MTLLSGWFGGRGADTTVLTPRDDIITSSRVLSSFGSMSGSIALTNDYTASYEDIAKRQLWVRVCLNKLSYSIGRFPLKTFERIDDTDRERATDSSLAALLRRPNGTKETGNPVGFKARIGWDLYCYANSITIKGQLRPDREPEWLRPVSPQGWRVESDRDENDTYIYRNPQTGIEEKPYPAWRIIHLVEPGPSCGGFGISRLEALRLTLSIEYAAQLLGASTFRNGARPGGIINIKSGLPSGNDQRAAAVSRFKEEILARFGGPSKAGLPAVLEGDVNWLAMSHNLDDSAVVAHRQLTREEVAAAFDIPQPAIGILDEANFASVDILHVMLYQDSLAWPVALIEDAFQQQLIDGVTGWENLYVEFDLNAALRGDLNSRATAYQKLLSIMTANELRPLENLPPLDDPEADKLHHIPGTAPDPAVGVGKQNTKGTNTTTGARSYAQNGAGHE